MMAAWWCWTGRERQWWWRYGAAVDMELGSAAFGWSVSLTSDPIGPCAASMFNQLKCSRLNTPIFFHGPSTSVQYQQHNQVRPGGAHRSYGTKSIPVFADRGPADQVAKDMTPYMGRKIQYRRHGYLDVQSTIRRNKLRSTFARIHLPQDNFPRRHGTPSPLRARCPGCIKS